MTKREAIKILISDFGNNCIASDWKRLNDEDWEIVEALKLKGKRERDRLRAADGTLLKGIRRWTT